MEVNNSDNIKSFLVPESMFCPITKQIFKVPIITDSGNCYEKEAIENWISQGNLFDPLTKQIISKESMRVCYTLKSLVQEYKKSPFYQLFEILELQETNQIKQSSEITETISSNILMIKSLIEEIKSFLVITNKQVQNDIKLKANIDKKQESKELIEFIKLSCKETPFFNVNGAIERINELIDNNCLINTLDYDKRTALHWASFHSSVEIVSYLLSLGSNINDQDNNLSTPLHLSLLGEKTSNSILLIQKGCKLSLKDCHGNISIHLACKIGNLEIVEKLLHYGVSHSVTNNDGQTCFAIVKNRQKCKIKQTLMALGINK